MKDSIKFSGLLVLILTAPLAEAADEPRDRARRLVAEGNELFRNGKPDLALERFQEALSHYPSTKIHVNIAEAHRALNRPAQAVAHYERYLAAGAKGPVAAEVTKRIESLESSIARITVSADVSGAQVRVDGEEVAPADWVRLPVDPGRRRVEAAAPDGGTFESVVVARAGATENVELTFRPTVGGTPPIDLNVGVEESPGVVVTGASPDPPVTSKWWFWGAIGAGVAVAAVAIGASLVGGDDFVPLGEYGRTGTSDWEKF